MNGDTLAGTFQAVEELNRLLVFQKMCLATAMLPDPVIGCGHAVPTQSDDQDLWL